jgi:hypothetical protein
MMRLRILITVFLLTFSLPARASIAIDLFDGPQVNGPYSFAGPCYCQDAYATGFFAVAPGSTVNFGVLTIEPATLNTHYPPYIPSMFTFALITNTDIDNPIDWAYPAYSETPTRIDLTAFVIPNDAHFIQFSWLGPYEYESPVVAAVPEISTWAMMLIGFVALGACFRSKGLMLTARRDERALRWPLARRAGELSHRTAATSFDEGSKLHSPAPSGQTPSQCLSAPP